MGTGTTSVGKYIAECQRVLESMKDDGIVYEVGVRALTPDAVGACAAHHSGYGTNLEGPISTVHLAIQRCHEAVHAMGVERIATDIRLGTRTDKPKNEAWAEGLTENRRKRESVLRRLDGKDSA